MEPNRRSPLAVTYAHSNPAQSTSKLKTKSSDFGKSAKKIAPCLSSFQDGTRNSRAEIAGCDSKLSRQQRLKIMVSTDDTTHCCSMYMYIFIYLLLFAFLFFFLLLKIKLIYSSAITRGFLSSFLSNIE